MRADQDQVAAAKEVAVYAHRDQVDLAGERYILHPGRVAAAVRASGASEAAVAVAWMHDVVEDTPVTLDDLDEMGFSDEVVTAVDAISRRKHDDGTKESYEDYMARCAANDIAAAVKAADIADNSQPERVAQLSASTQRWLRKKYAKGRAILAGEG